jgi:hypothetical protein
VKHPDLSACVVALSATHVEIELLKREAREIEFSSTEEESAYEQDDNFLAEEIHAIAEAACGNDEAEEMVRTNWDWYPNKSRSLELDEKVFSLSLLQSLAELLKGKYADWRIHLNVYSSLGQNPKEVGVACLFRQEFIVQKSLYERLQKSA